MKSTIVGIMNSLGFCLFPLEFASFMLHLYRSALRLFSIEKQPRTIVHTILRCRGQRAISICRAACKVLHKPFLEQNRRTLCNPSLCAGYPNFQPALSRPKISIAPPPSTPPSSSTTPTTSSVTSSSAVITFLSTSTASVSAALVSLLLFFYHIDNLVWYPQVFDLCSRQPFLPQTFASTKDC